MLPVRPSQQLCGIRVCAGFRVCAGRCSAPVAASGLTLLVTHDEIA
jgi:hypothetical protein